MVSVYVSYAWKDEEESALVEQLEGACRQRGVKLLRDRAELVYGESITAFMDRLASASQIVVVVSSKYLSSRYCLYELCGIWQCGEISRRVSPIVLRGTPCEPQHLDECVADWKLRTADLAEIRSKLHGGNPENAPDHLRNDALFLQFVRRCLAELFDIHALSEGQHRSTGFAALFDRLLATQPETEREDPKWFRQSDDEFLRYLENEVRRVLAISPLLTKAIAGQPGSAGRGKDLAAHLCAGDPYTVLSGVLRPATERALREGTKGGDNATVVWETAKELLAYLSLLAVSPNWVMQQEGRGEYGGAAFELCVRTHGGVEIASARVRQFRPRFVLSRQFGLAGANRLSHHTGEQGWDDENALRAIVESIASQVLPEWDTRSMPLADLCAHVNETLIEREKHKSQQHYYVLVETGDRSPLQNREFYDRLTHLLPNLTVIYMRSEGSQAPFVIKEIRLATIIREFLNLWESVPP